MALSPTSHRHLASLLGLVFLLFFHSKTSAQPVGLPWQVDPACESIITNGIAAVTCGTSQELPPNERFTFGMMNLNGVIPAAGRVDISSQVQAYHHPSWLVDSIGNVFGITMDRCGNTYVAASSNYSSYFLFSQSIIRYGDIGGGAESVQAAGTVYKIDGKTAQASVFAVLPQQAYSFFNITCEGLDAVARNTGPGLGNLVFSPSTKQFYVTNFEDGRIYRLDEDGHILDSFDPYFYDDGATGPPTDLNDIPYGITVNSDGSKLYFGTCGFVDENTGPKPKIFALPLNPDGSFVGNLNNTSLPAGATWNNFTGNEVLQFTLDSTTAFKDVISFSDLEFTPNGQLLVGARMGCEASVHTSYNHGGMAILLSQTGGVYSNFVGTIYTGYASSFGSSNECYGGVSAFSSPVGPAVQYAISSADILMEEGPHGICLVPENVFGAQGAPASPAGAISYGNINGTFSDPKGVGGDVKLFEQCDCNVVCPTEIIASASETQACSGTAINLTYSVNGGNAPLNPTWTDQNGTVVNPNDLVLTNTDCALTSLTFTVTGICEEDSSIVLSDTITVQVFPSEIAPFVTTSESACEISLTIDAACADYLTLVDPLPVISPGDSGTVVATVITTDPLQCGSEQFELSYNCPDCIITNLEATPLDCQDTTFLVEINLEAATVSDSFTVTDQNGNDLGTFSYNNLPVQVGPLYGDSITAYTLTVADLGVPQCLSSITLDPQDCLPKCGFFEMPNAFSPNNDSKNDKFYPVSLYEFQVLEFQIYDRWGKLVHDSTEPWDGKTGGKDCASEVYVYIITVDTFCGIEKRHGDVTLLR